MPLKDLNGLSEASRDAAFEYLRSVEESLCAVDDESVAETIEALEAHLLEELDPDSSPEEVRALTERLGLPDLQTVALCDVLEDVPDPVSSAGVGRALGVPYDVRIPSAERIALRWWNPSDRRVFVPRVFGIGWDLNFGRLAVALRLIEPDSEDEPFGQVGDHAFLAALAVPVALTAAIAVSWVVLAGQLPLELPVHWDWRGDPDRFAPASWSFAMVFAIALAPTVWAAWSVAARRPALVRGASIGFAAFLSAVAAAVWTLTLMSGLGVPTAGWIFPVTILGALVVPFAVMTMLARAGRAAEWRRDMDTGRG